MWIPRRGIALTAMLLALAASACTRVGDFDRPNSSVIHDEVFPVAGAFAATRRGEPVSDAPLTDDERTLRNLAYAIIAPPITRQQWLVTITDLRVSRIKRNNDPPFHVEKYGEELIETPYRSATARYSRLIDDIRADSLRIAPFFIVAKRVVDMDTARERSLVGVTRLRGAEQESAMARIAENRMIIGWVFRRFAERARGYRYALERLFLKQPAPAAVDAERALRNLEDRLSKIPVLTPSIAWTPPPANGPIIVKD